MMREIDGLAATRARQAGPRGRRSAPRVHDLSTLLTGVLGVTDVGANFPHRVTYHPTCHSLRCSVGDAPLRLLRKVRGLELAELPAAETCCGFGGTFSVKNPDVSAAMCADKVAAVQQSRAEVLCAADNSCLMHIGGAMTRERAGVSVMHLAEILASTEDQPAVPGGHETAVTPSACPPTLACRPSRRRRRPRSPIPSSATTSATRPGSSARNGPGWWPS